MYGVAEVGVQHIHVPPVPGYLDGVAYGPLHPGAGGVIGLCHAGVELLCDGIDYLRVLYGHDDGVPKVMVALDMGGHPYLVQYLRHLDP